MVDPSTFFLLEASEDEVADSCEEERCSDEDGDENGNLIGFVLSDHDSSGQDSDTSVEAQSTDREDQDIDSEDWSTATSPEPTAALGWDFDQASDADSDGNLAGFVVSDSDSDNQKETLRSQQRKDRDNPTAGRGPEKMIRTGVGRLTESQSSSALRGRSVGKGAGSKNKKFSRARMKIHAPRELSPEVEHRPYRRGVNASSDSPRPGDIAAIKGGEDGTEDPDGKSN